ncbi:AEC family transporter [Deferribacteraceae bacterium V6Fe1]|nr:AEC family transporter [Deferribacteraceae bacterium V6Fe1]
MEFFIIFSESLLPLFLIIGVAFFYNKNFNPNIKQITDMTLTIFAPIFVFESLTKHKITLDQLAKPFIFMSILTASLILLGYIIAKIFKFPENTKTPFALSISMVNVGNFGLPLIYFTFGPEAVTYSVIYFITFNISLSTVAIYLSSGKSKIFDILKDVFSIPLFHAFIIGMIFSYFGVTLPGSINKGLSLLSQAAIPLLIFILGLQLANIKFQGSYLSIIFIAVLCRLALSPLISFFALKAIDITGLEAKVALIQTSGPSAILPLMYAIKFNRSPDLIAAIIFFTTIFSGITLTLLIKLIA